MLEHLGVIPEANVCLVVGDYRLETLDVRDNRVYSVRAERVAATTAVDEDD